MQIGKHKLFLMAIICLFLLITSAGVVFPQKISEGDTATKIVLLGTGTPNAEPDRCGSAIAIVVNNTPYIVDCGPGVVRRANAAFQAGVEGLKVSKLTRVFITHLHSDHTAGYADLILTPWVLDRDEPLEAYGPKGIREMSSHILAAYEQDIHIRINGAEPANREGFKVKAYEIKPGVVYRDSNVTVEAFSVHHGSWQHAYGFRFSTGDRVIVISGDTTPSENLVKYARNCDVLIHEVYSYSGFEKREPVWQTYHAASHTSTYELAEIASRAKPDLLILYHQLYWGASDEELLAEIKEGYEGTVVSGKDLEVY